MELQDSRNPCIVHIAEILLNRGGLLTLYYNNRDETTFFTNERCHEIGWVSKQEQCCEYSTESSKLLDKARLNAVPHYVFGFTIVPEHKLEVFILNYFYIS